MYYFLGYKEIVIDETPWYEFFVLFYDTYSVTSFYVPKNKDNEEFIKSFNSF